MSNIMNTTNILKFYAKTTTLQLEFNSYLPWVLHWITRKTFRMNYQDSIEKYCEFMNELSY